jgi:hypothetical protein
VAPRLDVGAAQRALRRKDSLSALRLGMDEANFRCELAHSRQIIGRISLRSRLARPLRTHDSKRFFSFYLLGRAREIVNNFVNSFLCYKIDNKLSQNCKLFLAH